MLFILATLSIEALEGKRQLVLCSLCLSLTENKKKVNI